MHAVRKVALGGLICVGLATVAHGQQPTISVDAEGTVRATSVAIPMSRYISPEAKAYETGQARAHGWPMPSGPITGPGKAIDDWRRAMDAQIFGPALERQKAVYPVRIAPETMGGVSTEIVTPVGGVIPENKGRVLIELHAGGYQMGAGAAALVESVPIAAVGKIEVVAVDYRQGPEHRFPAASEDVAAVYRDLLRTHKPAEIGIYGCSAGGNLAASAIAWFDKEKLPLPGAIAMLSSSAGPDGGDSTYLAPVLNGQMPPPPMPAVETAPPYGYFAGVDLHDRLAAPVHWPDLLAKFPPTLVMTATRDMAMSGAVDTHARLVKAGVDAELHVWEGMGHCFLYNPDLPESKDAYDVIVRFFDRHLAR